MTRLTVRATFILFECEVIEEDERHDLALLKISPNPFADKGKLFDTSTQTMGSMRKAATLSSTRPVDGDGIAISGYPVWQTTLITTSGSVASSWAYQSVSIRDVNGATKLESDDVYIGDIQVNGGNSGGPVYLTKNGQVIGVCDAYKNAPLLYAEGDPVKIDGRDVATNSGLTVIVPARYVSELMKRHGL